MRLLRKFVAVEVVFFALLALITSTPAFAIQQSGASDTTLSADGSATGLNFSSDVTVSAPAGTVINIAVNNTGVTTTTHNTGSLGFLGGATVNGNVGTASTGLLKQISGGVANTQIIFTGTNIFATTTTLNGTGSINFNGASGGGLTGTTLAFNGDGTVRFGAGQNLTLSGAGAEPNVSTSTNNTGSLAFLGGSTITGQIGSTSNRLANIAGGATVDTQVIFTGTNIFATTTTVSGTGSINFTGTGGALTGTTLAFAGNGTVRLGDGQNLTLTGSGSAPNVTTSTTNTGSLAFLGASTITGQIGSTSNRLANIAAGATSGKIVTFGSDVFAVTSSVSGTGSVVYNGNLTGTTLNFAGDGRVDVADGKNLDVTQITTSTDDTGSIVFRGASTISASGTSVGSSARALHNIDINGGIVTLDTDSTGYFVKATNINSGGTLKFESAESLTGAINIASGGTVDLGSVTTTLTGNFTAASGSTIKTTITNSTTAGNVVASGTSVGVVAGSVINVTVSGYIPNGTVYKIIDAGSGAPGASTSVTDSSPTLSFTASVTATNDISITAARSFAGVATTANSTAVGNALGSFTATGTLASAIASLDNLSAAGVETALQQLDPNVDGGINQAAFNVVNGSFGTIDTRLDNARNGINTGSGQMGMSTGDEYRDLALWFQGFGAYSDQDDRNGIAGYTAGTLGGAGGMDWKTEENTRIGLSFSYGRSDVDINNSASATDVDNYQGSLYGGYDAEHYYVSGIAAFGWNQYDGARSIQFGTVDNTAASDYSGQQYSAKGTFGYKLPYDNFTLVPLASLMYSHLNIDGYTETNAGTLGLTVEDQGYDFLQSGLGARIEIPVHDRAKRVTWMPELHALWLYEFIGDEAEATSTFTGGGASFRTTGFSPEQSSFVTGAGLVLSPQDGFSIRFKYDLEWREDYIGNAGTATVKWEF